MITFSHKMAAHCESGAVTAQLNHAGLAISEPMVFGISGGLFFGYFKLPTLDFPTFVLRNQPGKIRTAVQKRLGVNICCQKNRDPDRAMAALDSLLAQEIPVAVQVDFFYMQYLPAYARAHFNAHFINIIGKDGSDYLISDVYYPKIARLDDRTLKIARSVKGPFAPSGFQFHVTGVNPDVDMRGAIKAGIKQTCFYMLRVPLPFMGIRGIRYFGDKVTSWPKLCRDTDHLSHEIMMIHVILEDRGTGGGGFRYLYASFLQEAGALLANRNLDDLAKEMMANGDEWRQISLFVARIGKERDLGSNRLVELRNLIHERARVEKDIFERLFAIAKNL
ncbi:MAG: DUF4872 domain-containing protein [Syntrophobacterales bacterium]|nr:MAG: DUF4872 domain-containing protein [Syntrophobacterales bacterium]